MTTDNEFVIWVAASIQDRGWSDAELARRAGMTPSAVSRVISGERGLTPEFVIATAQALDADPVWGLRRAGILPDAPPSVQEEQEALQIIRSLPPVQRRSALAMLHGLAGVSGRPIASAPADRQPEKRETDVPEIVTLDDEQRRMVKYIYHAKGLEPPEGYRIEATAELVHMLIAQIGEFYEILRPFYEAAHKLGTPEGRDRLLRFLNEEREGAEPATR